MFSIKINGLRNLEDSLDRLSDMEQNVIEPGSYKWFQGLRARLKSYPYPAKRPNQTYQRTGNLANSWGVDGSAGHWFIRNSAEYSEVVVGDNQGKYFKGRWWRLRYVVEELVPGLGEIMLKGIGDQWR